MCVNLCDSIIIEHEVQSVMLQACSAKAGSYGAELAGRHLPVLFSSVLSD